MGLDMYVRKTLDVITSPVDFEVAQSLELCYWRKHPNLHGWMEKLYREKGGVDECFNCVNVQLTKEDLDKLEWALTTFSLPKTEGFFFGNSDNKGIDRDLIFIQDAREAIKAGYSLFYTSWW